MPLSKEFINIAKKKVKGGLNITHAAKETCKELNLEYADSYRRRLSDVLRKKGVTKNEVIIENSKNFKKAVKKKIDKSKKTFIITWAQNATPVHDIFFKNLIAYKDNLNAGLHVIAGRYKNPTSVFTDREKDNWADEVLMYLDANRHNVHKHLQILSDVKVSPTASMPLSGLNGISGLESCIVGHPRMHLKFLPVLPDYPKKILLSTGACTVPNYTDSKSGKKGYFHHNLGAVIVELDGEHFHIRQITADDNGNFYDLYTKVHNGIVEYNKEGCVVAVLGDLHISQMDKNAEKATFEVLKKLKPQHTIIHDIFNGSSISHHTKKYPFELLELEEMGLDNVEKEIEQMLSWIEKRKEYNLVIPAANHNDWLDQWLNNTDWRKEKNKKAYLKYANIKAQGKAKKGIIAYVIENNFDNVVTLDYNSSYRVLGFELALHYDKGANGSRGSGTQFKNLNTKSIGAHGHSAYRLDGSFCVGTLTKMDMGYNKGLSSWSQTNVIVHPNAKAQHLNYVNGKFHR